MSSGSTSGGDVSHDDLVHLARLRLRNFRNYGRLDLEFGPGFHVITGPNAQGKTNLLEAMYLLATMRSFRGVANSQLVQENASGYFVGAQVVGQGTHDVRLYWSPEERRLTLDSMVIRRVSDYLGTFRSVVFCTEDIQLVKGPGRGRRRYLDLLLTQTDSGYLDCLLRYVEAVRSRNAVLKQQDPDAATLEGFTLEVVRSGEVLMLARETLTPKISEEAAAAYVRIAGGGAEGGSEKLRIEYAPSVRGDFAVELAKNRARERTFKMTLVGPHRDDVKILLDERPVLQFGSEGQKRTVAIALKAAQAGHLTRHFGTAPVLLIDDVMGGLDRRRRAGLMPLLDASRHAGGQVFFTCTEEDWPDDMNVPLQRWTVSDGVVSRGDG